MSIEKRIEALEGKARPEQPCTACDPGPKGISMCYAVSDPDPRSLDGQEPELQECRDCGRRYRVFASVNECS